MTMSASFGRRLCAASAAALLAAAGAATGADVTVVKEGAAKQGIDLAAFKAGADAAAQTFRRTLESDLSRSGWFELAPGRGAIAIGGGVKGGGNVEAACDVRNRATGQTYLSKSWQDGAERAARLAHVVADEIVRAVKGVAGIAGTRIVMVGKRDGQSDLYMCDYDGGNLVQVTRDGGICLSPAWSPRGDFIFYTSFLKGFPDIYRIDLAASRRERACAFPGLNMGARISPNGRQMAMVLSKDGNPEVYVMSLADRRLTRLTKTRTASEASPAWSPDGRQLVYVSDRAGAPQLYVMDIGSGKERRLTFQGQENVAPDWGPDGRIVCSTRIGGRYQLSLLHPAGGSQEILNSGGFDDEDPSWAPDGRHIVFTRGGPGQSDVYVLDVLGDPPVRLTRSGGSWKSPAWSPR